MKVEEENEKVKKKKETNKQQLSMSSKEEADIHTNKDINDDEWKGIQKNWPKKKKKEIRQ